MLKTATKICVLLVGVIGNTSLALDATAITPFQIDFQARYGAFKGDIALELRPAGDVAGHYHYEVITKARGLARLVRSGTARETSSLVITRDGVQPITYDYADGSGDPKQGSHIEFDWESGIAHSQHEGEQKDISLETGLLDRLGADLNTILELRAGETPEGFDIVYRNSIRRYDLTPQGEETIEVPAGSFKTIKYLRQRAGSKRSTLIWFAPEAQYLPIKIQQLKNGKPAVTMVAENIHLR